MPAPEARAYVVKTAVSDPTAAGFVFPAQKTMYGGKHIAAGDVVYVFASETHGGAGLIARGVVTTASSVPRCPGLARQTPRVSVQVQCTGVARRPLGRTELKPFSDCEDRQPQTELNFKCYRQATDKIVGIEPATATFLEGFF
ncbi:MAG: hypothetical protein EKK53_27505 [Burkholderiales bacterium]|nr:MAG: hypothetical protein EKK53_27505 [Burkholderiales bacterium]